MSAFTEAPVFTEAGRHAVKRHELKCKLEARRAQEEPQDDDATAELAADAATRIEEAMKEKAPQKPAKVVMGGKSLVTTEGADMSARENQRIQAMCCAGKAGKVKAFYKKEGVKSDLGPEEIDADAVLVFSGCKNCEFNVQSHCTKIFVESCEDCVLRLNGKIVTQTVECNRVERTNILIGTKVGTLQVEQSRMVNVVYAAKELFGWVVWAGCFVLRLQVGENDLMRCDFGLTQKFDKTIHIERTQFKVWYGPTGKLVCDKIIRLKNGFPTTKREDDEHQRRQEANMASMADRMGITISRKKDGARVKPNDPCPCGSGKKYKKCCRT